MITSKQVFEAIIYLLAVFKPDNQMNAATKTDVSNWIAEGRQKGATHMISVCDTFNHEDYPVYVMPGDNIEEILKKYSKNMQQVNEIADLRPVQETGIIDINGVKYKERLQLGSRAPGKMPLALYAFMTTAAFLPGVGDLLNSMPTPQQKDPAYLVREFGLIQRKESKLSRRTRDVIEAMFNYRYVRVEETEAQ